MSAPTTATIRCAISPTPSPPRCRRAGVSINTAAPPDARSYRVDFSLFRELAPAHQPRVDLAASIAGLVAGLRDIGFTDAEFRRSPRLIRLNTVAALQAQGALTPDLRWAWRAAEQGQHAERGARQ